MRISQKDLNLLETCPRKFQLTFLDRLASPLTIEKQEKIAWGSLFHLLMQQRELGLPIDSLLEKNSELQRCFDNLINSASDIFSANYEANTEGFRQAEHQRLLYFCDYLLIVRYDLLIGQEKEAKIIDWKTYPEPQNNGWLKKHWQTRLYLYVLAETSDYLPKEISMTYWFVKASSDKSNSPSSINFDYSEAKHKKTKEDLKTLLDNLTGWLKDYQENHQDFPQVDENKGVCKDCQFAVRCRRSQKLSQEDLMLKNLSNLEEIEEISVL